MPSCPSADDRRVRDRFDAERRHVGRRRAGRSPRAAAWLRASAPGAPLHDLARHTRRRPRRARPRARRCGPAQCRARAPRRSARRSETARGRPSGRSSRARTARSPPGSVPSLTSVKPNIVVVGGDDDVADRDEPGAAAERRAVDAADHRHRQRDRARGTSAPSRMASSTFCSWLNAGHPAPSTSRSAPAQNVGPAPARTTSAHRAVAARPNSPTSVSSAIIPSLKALRTSGRLSTSALDRPPSRRTCRDT